LQCLHCYSNSSPSERDDLPEDLLRRAITDAAAAGYNVVSFSGGEPLLYRGLSGLLNHASQLGMHTTVTTNGMLSDPRRLANVSRCLHLMAISLDGKPEDHNYLRNSNRAFETMRDRLRHVRDAGIPFGFLFTLTRHNLEDLDWIANFACEERAQSLQIHPLESAGRAQSMLSGSSPDDVDVALAWLKANRLATRYQGSLKIHIDLVHKSAFQQALANMPEPEITSNLASLVSPLVVEADGTLSPAQHGFPRHYSLGNLYDRSLADLASVWLQGPAHTFSDLCRRTVESLNEPSDLPIVNWYQELAKQAALASPNNPLRILPLTA
jgi:MoaA/NifB/PqqE/SkfB family radical SAM enzyme